MLRLLRCRQVALEVPWRPREWLPGPCFGGAPRSRQEVAGDGAGGAAWAGQVAVCCLCADPVAAASVLSEVARRQRVGRQRLCGPTSDLVSVATVLLAAPELREAPLVQISRPRTAAANWPMR